MVSVKIDEIDTKILIDLLKDGRKTFQDIATEAGVSKNAISKHYIAMEKAGVIVGSTTQMNYHHLGFCAFAEIYLIDFLQDYEKTQKELQKIPGMIASFFYSFSSTLLAIFALRQISDLGKIKEMIRDIAGSVRIRTYYWGGHVINIPENLSSLALLEKNETKTPDEKKVCQAKLSEIGNYDQIDTQIIDRLATNGRISFKKIADDIGVTADTVTRRYRKLEKNRTIKVTVQIDPRKLGYQGTLDAIINLKSQNNTHASIMALSKIPDVFCIVETSQGDADLHVWSLIKDVKHLLSIQDQIESIPNFFKMNYCMTKAFLDRYPGTRQTVSI